ncbi:hypothetical protein Trydic_g14336 [Trypoxylus dichotomus]
MKKRIAILMKDCLKDTNCSVFLIEHEKNSPNTEFMESHVIGDSIIIDCRPSKPQEYTSIINRGSSYGNCTTYHLRRIHQEKLELVEGQNDNLNYYFTDEHEYLVCNREKSRPTPII